MKMRHAIFWLFLTTICHAASTNSLPKFQDIYQVLSTNTAVISADDLDRAAAQGLLHQLAPKISLVSQVNDPGLAPLAQTRVFDGAYAYFRVATVNKKLPDAFRSAYRTIADTNGGKIKGIVLDLRFAGGADYDAAAKTADSFLDSDQPLLDWQQGSAKATKKSDAILVPVAILVNSQTSGAAEALAAVMRNAGAGLILGNVTAGDASIFKEFPLSNGDKLRVAVARVTEGDGKVLAAGVTPDIAVDSNLQEERAYLQDPYKDMHPAQLGQTDMTTNLPAPVRPRFNEKELVREHTAGEDSEDDSDEAPPVRADPGPPVVADPVLARALDLLKGLAVVQPNRPG